MEKYKELVQEITNLPWEKYEPKGIIAISYATAREFAKSLRRALEVHFNNRALLKMALGELKTNNLKYRDYDYKGDHCEFLLHFMNMSKQCDYNKGPYISKIQQAGAIYHRSVCGFTDAHRAMTIFSREQELPGIFKKILQAHDWDALGLGFFKYYLERHIELDSADGGHGDLTKGFTLNEKVLSDFYLLRRELYRALE